MDLGAGSLTTAGCEEPGQAMPMIRIATVIMINTINRDMIAGLGICSFAHSLISLISLKSNE